MQEGVVSDENTVFKWDGTEYPIKAWNHDLSMKEAIRLSAFWYYQIIAENAGKDRMQYYLDNIGYGNKDISGGITQFRQQSTLTISPKEQADILRNKYECNIPFDSRNIDILKEIIKKYCMEKQDQAYHLPVFNLNRMIKMLMDGLLVL